MAMQTDMGEGWRFNPFVTAVWTLSNARACSRANQSKTSEFARTVMKGLTLEFIWRVHAGHGEDPGPPGDCGLFKHLHSPAVKYVQPIAKDCRAVS